MKPHPRLRRVALVSGAVVSVLLSAVWVASARWTVSAFALSEIGSRGSHDASSWSIAGGRLHLNTFIVWHDPRGGQILWNFGPTREPFRMWFLYSFSNRIGGYTLAVPLWVPAGLSLLGTAAVWRLDARARRRARVGECAKCGYDRAGLAPGATCPECGGGPPAVNHYPKEGEAPGVVGASGPPSPG